MFTVSLVERCSNGVFLEATSEVSIAPVLLDKSFDINFGISPKISSVAIMIVTRFVQRYNLHK